MPQFLIDLAILRHGVLREFIPNGDRVFLSRIVAEIPGLCPIVHKHTTGYHLQTNALTEQLNRTVGNMLAMDESSNNLEWMMLFVSSDLLIIPLISRELDFQYSTSSLDGHPPDEIDSFLPFPPYFILDKCSSNILCGTDDYREPARLPTLYAQYQRPPYDEEHRPVTLSVGDLILL